jgi:hypothetical protein
MKEIVKLGIDICHGNLANYSKEDANEVFRKALIDVFGTDKIDFKTYRRNQVGYFEIIETILDQLIVEGWENNKFFDKFVDYKDLNLGDTNVFLIEDPSLFNVAMIAEGTTNLRKQRLDSKSITVTTDIYGVAIREELNRVLAGRINFGTLVDRVAKSFNQKIMTLIYNQFYSAYSSLPSTYNITGTYAEADLVTLIQHVEAATGRKAEIWGTKSALSKVTTAIVSDSAKEEYNQLGYFGKFNGTPMYEIEQVHTPGTHTFAINDSVVWVIPGETKPVKFVTEGDAIVVDNSGNALGMADLSMDYTLLKRFGISTIVASKFGVYRLA